MDRLFGYNLENMEKQLLAFTDEMREEYYKNSEEPLSLLSTYAMKYLKTLFVYIQDTFVDKECHACRMMEELYRAAKSDEHTYLMDYDEINSNTDPMSDMKGKYGIQSVLYAARLLFFYYIAREKTSNSVVYDSRMKKAFRDIEHMDKIGNAVEKGTEKGIEKVPSFLTREPVSEAQFMRELHKHMDKYYVGQELLKKKLCAVIDLWKFYENRTVLLIIGPSGSGKNYMMETIGSFKGLECPIVYYDCSKLTPSGFRGADVEDIFVKARKALEIEAKRKSSKMAMPVPTGSKCIIFLDEIDKIINFNHDANGESVNAMVQQQLLAALAGTDIIGGVDTSQVLFILGGAFPRIDELEKDKAKEAGFSADSSEKYELEDSLRDKIIAIGGEKEFIGRIDDIVKLEKLSRENLKEILMNENFGVITKVKQFYDKSGVKIVVNDDIIDELVELIVREDSGARAVKNEVNKLINTSYYYDMMVNGYNTMIVHKGMLHGQSPIMLMEGDSNGKTAKCS